MAKRTLSARDIITEIFDSDSDSDNEPVMDGSDDEIWDSESDDEVDELLHTDNSDCLNEGDIILHVPPAQLFGSISTPPCIITTTTTQLLSNSPTLTVQSSPTLPVLSSTLPFLSSPTFPVYTLPVLSSPTLSSTLPVLSSPTLPVSISPQTSPANNTTIQSTSNSTSTLPSYPSTSQYHVPSAFTSRPSTPSTWSKNYIPIYVGPCNPIPDSPLDIFKMYFTDFLIDIIVQETNRYASDVLSDRYSNWQNVTSEEVLAYLGFKILMGINVLPSNDDYWKRDSRLNYQPVSSRISRDRFRDVNRFLHFVDNSTLPQKGQPTYDKLGKIRPIIHHLSETFKNTYQPNKEMAVDEAMIKFQGRSTIKQYLPMKPVKRGIKV